jgi:hypothetical protein
VIWNWQFWVLNDRVGYSKEEFIKVINNFLDIDELDSVMNENFIYTSTDGVDFTMQKIADLQNITGK